MLTIQVKTEKRDGHLKQVVHQIQQKEKISISVHTENYSQAAQKIIQIYHGLVLQHQDILKAHSKEQNQNIPRKTDQCIIEIHREAECIFRT